MWSVNSKVFLAVATNSFLGNQIKKQIIEA